MSDHVRESLLRQIDEEFLKKEASEGSSTLAQETERLREAIEIMSRELPRDPKGDWLRRSVEMYLSARSEYLRTSILGNSGLLSSGRSVPPDIVAIQCLTLLRSRLEGILSGV